MKRMLKAVRTNTGEDQHEVVKGVLDASHEALDEFDVCFDVTFGGKKKEPPKHFSKEKKARWEEIRAEQMERDSAGEVEAKITDALGLAPREKVVIAVEMAVVVAQSTSR